MSDDVAGVWESIELLTPREVEQDKEYFVAILNALPQDVTLDSGTFVLPNGRIWRFRMLKTSVVVQ